MPKTAFPYVVSDPVLRSCRRGQHRVAATAMCDNHDRTCLTCCSLRRRSCHITTWHVPPQPERTEAEVAAGRAELTHIRNQLFGYLEET